MLVLKTLQKVREESVGDSWSDSASYIWLMEDSQFVGLLVAVQFVLSTSTSGYRRQSIASGCGCWCCTGTRMHLWFSKWEKLWKQSNWHQLSNSLLRSLELQKHGLIEAMLVHSIRVLLAQCVLPTLIMWLMSYRYYRKPNHHEGFVTVQHLTPFALEELNEDKLSIDEREDLITDITKWKKKYNIMKYCTASLNWHFFECSAQTFPVLHKVFLMDQLVAYHANDF